MRPQGNKLIIRLRPLLSVWTARRSLWKECNPFREAMKGALPGFRLSSLSRRRQWTEHATRWAWPRSPSPSAHLSTLPGRSGLLTRWRYCTFQWSRPPEEQQGGGKKEKEKADIAGKIVLSVLWGKDNCQSTDLSWMPLRENSKIVSKLLHLHSLTLLLPRLVWGCWSHTSSTSLMRTDSRGEEGAHRYQTTQTKPPKNQALQWVVTLLFSLDLNKR